MSDIVFQLSHADRDKALTLLDEIKRQSGSLVHENEATGHVIAALAESVGWALLQAHQVKKDIPF